MATIFADSFGHYDTAGIALKYSIAGGSINANLAHVRTGKQSLKIQAGDAPAILNFTVSSDVTQTFTSAPQFSQFNVGFAYQTDSLDGDVCSLRVKLGIEPTPEQTILTLSLNANGSLSLKDGSNAEIGHSAAGVITVGVFYYLSLTVDLLAAPNTAVLNVTNAAFASSDVLTVSNFTVSQTYVDALYFGGPAAPHFAYVNDFQLIDTSDATVPALAPNIVWAVANQDGTALAWNWVNYGSWQPVGSNHTPLVDSVPENQSQGIQFVASPQYSPAGPPFFIDSVAETYFFDVSRLPAGRTIAAVQGVFLFEYGAVAIAGVTVTLFLLFQDNLGNTWGAGICPPYINFPFTFLLKPVDLDPFTGLPWQSDDWKLQLRQAGPKTLSLE